VAVDCVVRNATHRDAVPAGVLRPRGERQVERPGSHQRVLVEHLVEVAHPEEHDGVLMLALRVEILAHRRRCRSGARHEDPRRVARYYHPSVMVILALDTTTPGGSTALMRGADVVDVRASDAARPQAERLPADLMALLGRHGLELPDIDLYAVATGPGSFTGLRVGIATMQGLALAQGRPLIGISGLDALAWTARKIRTDVARIATWVDAWRGEVYAALYENGAEVMPPTVDAPGHLLRNLRGATLFVGDGAAAYAHLITAA